MTDIRTFLKETPEDDEKIHESLYDLKLGPHLTILVLQFHITSPKTCKKCISIVYKLPSQWYIILATQTD